MEYSRAQYLAGEVTHEEYYDQFVTTNLCSIVIDYIGLLHITQSNDRFFNDIPLSRWDSLYSVISSLYKNITLAESVCIAKAAARQIKNK